MAGHMGVEDREVVLPDSPYGHCPTDRRLQKGPTFRDGDLYSDTSLLIGLATYGGNLSEHFCAELAAEFLRELVDDRLELFTHALGFFG